MSETPKIPSSEKTDLHPRNKHRLPYDFKELSLICPELKPFVSVNRYQNESIDFSDPKAVKVLNKALLLYFYGIKDWDIPPGYLCPPIPGRVDYIHYLADLLGIDHYGIPPRGPEIKVLDIGVGANGVYPILGIREYDWQFIGSDIDPLALQSLEKIVKANEFLMGSVDLRLQRSAKDVFKGVLKPGEQVDAVVCNPPFHASLAEAQAGTDRKWKNLGIKKQPKKTLNFGGQNTELWCEGGEASFVYRMIQQSVEFRRQCFWFTSLISKSSNLPAVYGSLQKAKAVEVKTIQMAQGQKVSRFVAWTFLSEQERKEWSAERWK